jgi:hypothetical protein
MNNKQKYMDELNAFDTLNNMLNDTEYKQSNIDHWQDVRERASIVIMHAILNAYLTSPAKSDENFSSEKLTRHVVRIADALVEELKKKVMWK